MYADVTESVTGVLAGIDSLTHCPEMLG